MLLDDLQDFLGSIHGAGDQLLGADRSAQAAGSLDTKKDFSVRALSASLYSAHPPEWEATFGSPSWRAVRIAD